MLGTCKNCDGNTTTKKWTDSRKGPLSSWFSSIYTNAMYAAAFPNRHRLFKEVPGLGITHYIADILHSKWLGADQYFLGSAIALLTHHVLADTPAANLQRVWGDVRDEYKRQNVPHKIRYAKIRMSQYFAQSLKLPKLKGTGVQCQGITKVFAKVFEKHMDGDDPVHGLVLQYVVNDGVTTDFRVLNHVALFTLLYFFGPLPMLRCFPSPYPPACMYVSLSYSPSSCR